MPPRKTKLKEEVATEVAAENTDASPPKRKREKKIVSDKADDVREPRFPRAAKNKKPEITQEEPVKTKASGKKNEASQKKNAAKSKKAKDIDEDEPMNEDEGEAAAEPEVPKKKARGKAATKKADADDQPGNAFIFIHYSSHFPQTKCRLSMVPRIFSLFFNF